MDKHDLNDASMEEILASIRKIINEDDENGHNGELETPDATDQQGSMSQQNGPAILDLSLFANAEESDPSEGEPESSEAETESYKGEAESDASIERAAKFKEDVKADADDADDADIAETSFKKVQTDGAQALPQGDEKTGNAGPVQSGKDVADENYSQSVAASPSSISPSSIKDVALGSMKSSNPTPDSKNLTKHKDNTQSEFETKIEDSAKIEEVGSVSKDTFAPWSPSSSSPSSSASHLKVSSVGSTDEVESPLTPVKKASDEATDGASDDASKAISEDQKILKAGQEISQQNESADFSAHPGISQTDKEPTSARAERPNEDTSKARPEETSGDKLEASSDELEKGIFAAPKVAKAHDAEEKPLASFAKGDEEQTSEPRLSPDTKIDSKENILGKPGTGSLRDTENEPNGFKPNSLEAKEDKASTYKASTDNIFGDDQTSSKVDAPKGSDTTAPAPSKDFVQASDKISSAPAVSLDFMKGASMLEGEELNLGARNMLEGIIQEVVEPYLKTWLSENLGPLVQQVAKEELRDSLGPIVKQVAKEEMRENLTPVIRDVAKEEMRENLEPLVQQVAKEEMRENLMPTVRDVAKEELRESLDPLVKSVAKEEIRNLLFLAQGKK